MNTRGFTLIEMIVVVGVIGILATIIVLQFQGTNKNFGLENAESIVRSDIRRVMSLASTGKTCCYSQATPEGYGLITTPGDTSYTIYADVDGDHQFVSGGSDEVIDTVDLETDELISNVLIQTCSPAAVPGGPCDLLVTVPGDTMYANGITASTYTVTLQQTQNAETATLTLDLDSGQLY